MIEIKKQKILRLYKNAGLNLIPLCSPSIPHCHGGFPCKSPGKVPVESGWQKNAGVVLGDERLAKLEAHRGNFGMPLPPDLVALDPDSQKDFNALYSLITKEGLLAWIQKSGRGGHFIMRQPVPGAIHNSVKTEFEGIKFDIRGVGGQIVVKPSVHFNGTPYEWVVTPWDLPYEKLSILPTEYLKNTAPCVGRGSQKDWLHIFKNGVATGSRNETVKSLTGKLLSHRLPLSLVLEIVSAWNSSRNLPPLSDDEVSRTVISVARTILRRLDV